MNRNSSLTIEWKKYRLRHLVTLNPPVPAEVKTQENAEALFLPMDSIHEFADVDTEINRPIGDLLTGYSYLSNGDVSYAKVTPCFENGKGWLAQDLGPLGAFATTELTVLRPSSRITASFLSYVLQTDSFRSGGISSMTGAGGLKRVSENFTRDYEVNLPPLDEQKQIAEFLDRETAEIDAFIADQERLIELLTERRRNLFTSSLNRHLRQASVEEMLADRDRAEEGWDATRLGRVVQINAGQVDPTDDRYRHMTLIAPNHVESWSGRIIHLQTAEDQGADSGKYLVRAGQVIYSKIRPALMKCVIAPDLVLCSADMYGLQPNERFLTAEFLAEWLRSDFVYQYAVEESLRVAMPKLNHESLKAMPIVLPPISIQQQVLEEVTATETELDSAISDARAAIALSRERRAALITAAVRGQIRVGEQASSCESPHPAEQGIAASTTSAGGAA